MSRVNRIVPTQRIDTKREWKDRRGASDGHISSVGICLYGRWHRQYVAITSNSNAVSKMNHVRNDDVQLFEPLSTAILTHNGYCLWSWRIRIVWNVRHARESCIERQTQFCFSARAIDWQYFPIKANIDSLKAPSVWTRDTKIKLNILKTNFKRHFRLSRCQHRRCIASRHAIYCWGLKQLMSEVSQH